MPTPRQYAQTCNASKKTEPKSNSGSHNRDWPEPQMAMMDLMAGNDGGAFQMRLGQIGQDDISYSDHHSGCTSL